MTFAESFVECMGGAGIKIDSASVPADKETFSSVIAYVQSTVQEFGDYSDDFDEATTDGGSLAVLALSDPDVGAIDASYDGLLQAFDAAAGFPLSTCLEWSVYCVDQAGQAQ